MFTHSSDDLLYSKQSVRLQLYNDLTKITKVTYARHCITKYIWNGIFAQWHKLIAFTTVFNWTHASTDDSASEVIVNESKWSETHTATCHILHWSLISDDDAWWDKNESILFNIYNKLTVNNGLRNLVMCCYSLLMFY